MKIRNEISREPELDKACLDTACDELRAFHRRRLLMGVPALAAGVAALPGVALGRGGGRRQRDVYLNMFMRGGMDGLTTCVPYGAAVRGDLYTLRPDLAIQPHDPLDPTTAVDLDGEFGLAPAAAPLLTPWQNGHLAIVHATGSTDETRSHFDAFKHMEFGIPEQPLGSQTSGWLARHMQVTAPVAGSVLRGVAIDDLVSQTLAQAPSVLPIPDLSSFELAGLPATEADRRAALSGAYADEPPPVGPAALSTFDTIDLLATIDFDNYVPANGAVYPVSPLGEKLRMAAALIKADVGVEVITADKGGWDLHNQLGPLTGDMADNLADLTQSLEAFYLDLLDDIGRITLVVQSEFGRRVNQNASLGLDHGHGNCMLVMGGNVLGGQVLSDWPGLTENDLDRGDLAVTIDYRDILSEILEKRLMNTNLGYVFPEYVPNFRGLLR